MSSVEAQQVAEVPTELTQDSVALAYASIREMASTIQEFADRYASTIKDGRPVLKQLTEDTQEAANRLLEASDKIKEGSSQGVREKLDVLLGKALELCSSAVERAAQFDEQHKLQHRLVTALGDAYLQAASGLTRARQMAAGATQQYVQQPLTDATAAVVVGLGRAAQAAEEQATRLSETDMAKSAGSSLQSVGEQLDKVAAQVSGLKPFEQAAFALHSAREQVTAVRARWAELPPQDVPQEAAAEALAAARGALAAVQAAALARTAPLREGTTKALADAQSALAAVLSEASGRVQHLRIATESLAERTVRAGTGAVKVVTTGCLGAAGRADARIGVAKLVLAADEKIGAAVPLPLGAARKAVGMLPRAEGAGSQESPVSPADVPVPQAPRTLSSQVLEGAEIAAEGCTRAVGACDSASRGACVSLPLRVASTVDAKVFCGMGHGLVRGGAAVASASVELVRWSAGVFFDERARAIHAMELGAAGEAKEGGSDSKKLSSSSSSQEEGASSSGGGGGAAAAAGWLPAPGADDEPKHPEDEEEEGAVEGDGQGEQEQDGGEVGGDDPITGVVVIESGNKKTKGGKGGKGSKGGKNKKKTAAADESDPSFRPVGKKGPAPALEQEEGKREEASVEVGLDGRRHTSGH